MAMRARPFTADGLVIAADKADVVKGLVYTGFTTVNVYNGTDATGTLIIAGTGPGTITLSDAVRCDNGVFVDVTGSGKGSLFV